jgi:hyperosmotically inducible periplasmic protein
MNAMKSKGRRKKGGKLLPFSVVVVGAGALAMYLFDPDRGRSRRAKLQDRVGALFRGGFRRVENQGRYVASRAEGLKQKVAASASGDEAPPNDQALKAKIESEVLTRARYPKGKIAVNVEDGVAVLRGEVDDLQQMNSIEQEVRKITGVIEVSNLLHVPGETPPNKEAALDASKRK